MLRLVLGAFTLLPMVAAIALCLPTGCSRSSSTTSNRAIERVVLPDRVKGYIIAVLIKLHDHPDMTQREFSSVIIGRDLADDFVFPDRYYGDYVVRVCSKKEVWLDSAKAEKLVPLVIVEVNDAGKEMHDLLFAYTGKQTDSYAISADERAQFVTLPINTGNQKGGKK